MATKAEVARMTFSAVAFFLDKKLKKAVPALDHVKFGGTSYDAGDHVFEVVADGETFRVVVSKPRDFSK